MFDNKFHGFFAGEVFSSLTFSFSDLVSGLLHLDSMLSNASKTGKQKHLETSGKSK